MRIAELMGGSATIRERPDGPGAQFALRLPLQCPAGHVPARAASRRGVSSTQLVSIHEAALATPAFALSPIPAPVPAGGH